MCRSAVTWSNTKVCILSNSQKNVLSSHWYHWDLEFYVDIHSQGSDIATSGAVVPLSVQAGDFQQCLFNSLARAPPQLLVTPRVWLCASWEGRGGIWRCWSLCHVPETLRWLSALQLERESWSQTYWSHVSEFPSSFDDLWIRPVCRGRCGFSHGAALSAIPRSPGESCVFNTLTKSCYVIFVITVSNKTFLTNLLETETGPGRGKHLFLSSLLVLCSCYSEDKSSPADVSAITAALLSSCLMEYLLDEAILSPLSPDPPALGIRHAAGLIPCPAPRISLRILAWGAVQLCDTEGLSVRALCDQFVRN